MRDVLDRQDVVARLAVEIRSRYQGTPHGAVELHRLGLTLAHTTRLIVVHDGPVALTPDMAAALHDPLAEVLSVGSPAEQHIPYVDIFCKAGVTDAEGETALRALNEAGAAATMCRAGTRQYFEESVPGTLRAVVARILGNPLIHTFTWSDDDTQADTVPATPATPDMRVRRIDLVGAGEDSLAAISRDEGLALDLDEMRAIQAHFASLRRAPTDVEMQSIALAWSEHCSHKTFKATIAFDLDGTRETIRGLLSQYIMAPTVALDKPWVRSAFVDNAGIIAFDDRFDLSFKVETHNHPSALEPFGGAHTGVGGVIRDVLAVSAVPIANTDVLCFGDLNVADEAIAPGAMHPRSTMQGVVRGVADYGNNMGIPTVGGAVVFHPGYASNPLVHCGTLGIAPRNSHPTEPRPGDTIVLLGGHTGRDGLHGATMSSESLDRATVASGSVQIGAPITEKVLRDVLPRLRDERLYNAINDCGAGGLCSAVGEMSEELGVEVDLSLVPLKYAGLLPWEIWLSEAQERMVLAVSPASVSRVSAICAEHDLDATVIGTLRDDGSLRLRYGNEPVAELDLGFLYDGGPTRVLQARFTTPSPAPENPQIEAADYEATLLRLLPHRNISSKEEIIRRYDYEVQGGTVGKPLVGHAGPSDAAVIQPFPDSWRGVVLAHGINPLYGVDDPYAMTMLAVDEALRNLTATGASIDRAAVLDNFCWGEVDTPEGLGQLVRAAQGCRDTARRYGVPFISGKDSLRNTSVAAGGPRSIPGTILVSAVSVVEDVRHTVSMDLKAAGSTMYILGTTSAEFGGSHLNSINGSTGGRVPQVRDTNAVLMRRLADAIQRGLVLSCHDLSEGGLAVATAEMVIAGGIGMCLTLDAMRADTDGAAALLFSESSGRFLAEVSPDHASEFEAALTGLPLAAIGRTEDEIGLVIVHAENTVIDLPVARLDGAWRTPLGSPEVVLPAPNEIDGIHRSKVDGLGPASIAGVPATTGADDAGALPGQVALHGAPHALVLVGPGINCDAETVEACRIAGADARPVHLNQLLDSAIRLDDFAMLVLPGGFSYGDHLGAGAMLATILRHRLLDDLHRFIDDGRPVLGICNGFQVLARLGLLGPVSLVHNSTEQFECRWVRLYSQVSQCLFLEGLDEIELPIAHGQGRVVVEDGALLQMLPLAPLRYVDNPNGSIANIAGVCSPAGNVFGLMPHPERYLTPYQHPYRRAGTPDGLRLFQNAVRYVKASV